MKMKKRKALLFVLFAILCSSALMGAEDPFSDILAKRTEEKKIAPVSADTTPNPSALSPDWWRYFDCDITELKERIENQSLALNTALSKLPDGLQQDLTVKTNRINQNLSVLLELRQKEILKPSPLPQKQKNYSLDEWLDITHKIQLVEADYNTEKDNLERNTKLLKTMQQNYDGLTAAYLSLASESGEKAVKGIELILNWTKLAVFSERLRLQKLALGSRNDQLENLKTENLYAKKNLRAGKNELIAAQQAVNAAEKEFEVLRDYAARLSLSTAAYDQNSDEGKAKTLLAEQKLKHAEINESAAEANLTHAQLAFVLLEILGHHEDLKIDNLREQHQKTLEYLSKMEASHKTWREAAERYQGRAGQSLALLINDTEAPSIQLKTIAQQQVTEAQDMLLSLQKLETELQDIKLLNEQIGIFLNVKDGTLKKSYEDFKYTFSKAWSLLWENLSKSLFRIGDTPVTTLGILRFLLIITIAWWLSYFVRRGITHLSLRQAGNATFLYTFGRLSHYFILILGISIGLSSIGVDLSNFALIAGALSLGIGFGMQAIVSNFVSGLIILFERSLRVGDFVELSSGVSGEVKAVNVRSTLVTTPDMVDILVPNSEFVNGKVINWTLTDASRRIHIPFGVAYGSDKELVRKAGLEAAEKVPYTIRNRPGRNAEVWLTNFGDSSLDFELVVWVQPDAVKKPNRVRASYYWELETALVQAGIQIPFPQRDIHIHSHVNNNKTSLLLELEQNDDR